MFYKKAVHPCLLFAVSSWNQNRILFSDAIAQPASVRCRSERVWDFPTSILKLDFKKSDSKIASWYQLALLAANANAFRIAKWFFSCYTGLTKILSGGCYSDCTDNANREQTLPHLRRSPCRIPTAPNDRWTWAAKHGKRGYRYCTECAPLSVCGYSGGKLERCTFSVDGIRNVPFASSCSICFLRFVASSFVEKLSHLLQSLPCSSW